MRRSTALTRIVMLNGCEASRW